MVSVGNPFSIKECTDVTVEQVIISVGRIIFRLS
jgi:hypothetical protein